MSHAEKRKRSDDRYMPRTVSVKADVTAKPAHEVVPPSACNGRCGRYTCLTGQCGRSLAQSQAAVASSLTPLRTASLTATAAPSCTPDACCGNGTCNGGSDSADGSAADSIGAEDEEADVSSSAQRRHSITRLSAAQSPRPVEPADLPPFFLTQRRHSAFELDQTLMPQRPRALDEADAFFDQYNVQNSFKSLAEEDFDEPPPVEESYLAAAPRSVARLLSVELGAPATDPIVHAPMAAP